MKYIDFDRLNLFWQGLKHGLPSLLFLVLPFAFIIWVIKNKEKYKSAAGKVQLIIASLTMAAIYSFALYDIITEGIEEWILVILFCVTHFIFLISPIILLIIFIVCLKHFKIKYKLLYYSVFAVTELALIFYILFISTYRIFNVLH